MDVFSKIPADIGSSLFADDGALWKRGKNMKYILSKVQSAIDELTEWDLTGVVDFLWRKHKLLFSPGKERMKV